MCAFVKLAERAFGIHSTLKHPFKNEKQNESAEWICYLDARQPYLRIKTRIISVNFLSSFHLTSMLLSPQKEVERENENGNARSQSSLNASSSSFSTPSNLRS
jgi:hypothetical protein